MNKVLETLNNSVTDIIKISHYADIQQGDYVKFLEDYNKDIRFGEELFVLEVFKGSYTLTKNPKSRKPTDSWIFSKEVIETSMNNNIVTVFRKPKKRNITKDFILDFLRVSGIIYFLSPTHYNAVSCVKQTGSNITIFFRDNPRYEKVLKKRISHALNFMGIAYEIYPSSITILKSQSRKR